MGESKGGWSGIGIDRLIRLRLARRWRKLEPSNVPAGHVAVIVGRSATRFVVRVAHLNHPIFRELLRRAEIEYGFSAHSGPLSLPCDEWFFEDALRDISDSSSQPSKTKLSSHHRVSRIFKTCKARSSYDGMRNRDFAFVS